MCTTAEHDERLRRSRRMEHPGLPPPMPSAVSGRSRQDGPEEPLPILCVPPPPRPARSGRPPKPARATARDTTAGQRSAHCGSPRRRTHEQRIQSVESELTPRHLARNVSAGQRPAQGGGWDSNPRPTDYEPFGDLGGLCRSVPILDVFAGPACLSVCVLCGACRSVPVLVAPQWPLTVIEGDPHNMSGNVRPVQPRGWNLRAADSPADEQRLRPDTRRRSLCGRCRRPGRRRTGYRPVMDNSRAWNRSLKSTQSNAQRGT
jgi:hypothetical protein